MDIGIIKNIVSGFMLAVGVIGPALAIGFIGTAAVKAISRNPEAYSKIQTITIIAIAFAEALAIYVFALALIIKFS